MWCLDRLGRSIKHLIATLTDLSEIEFGFRSLTENIDTTTPGGRLVFHIFAALAEFERDLIRERTKLVSPPRLRGRQGGRPPTMCPKQVTTARQLYDQWDLTVEQIGEVLGVSRTTIYRALRRAQPAKA